MNRKNNLVNFPSESQRSQPERTSKIASFAAITAKIRTLCRTVFRIQTDSSIEAHHESCLQHIHALQRECSAQIALCGAVTQFVPPPFSYITTKPISEAMAWRAFFRHIKLEIHLDGILSSPEINFETKEEIRTALSRAQPDVIIGFMLHGTCRAGHRAFCLPALRKILNELDSMKDIDHFTDENLLPEDRKI